MRSSTRFIVIALVLSVSILAWGQAQINEQHSLLVRMSFELMGR